MKTRKKIPVKIPLDNTGSFNDVLQDFINKMQEVTGGDVDVHCDLQGKITIYFENDPRPKIEKRPALDIEMLYRNNY